MKEIILTGYNEEEFVKKFKKGEKGGCYNCKRCEGDKSVYLLEGGGAGLATIHLRILAVKFDDVTFNYLLCQECMPLFQGTNSAPKEEDRDNAFSPNMN